HEASIRSERHPRVVEINLSIRPLGICQRKADFLLVRARAAVNGPDLVKQIIRRPNPAGGWIGGYRRASRRAAERPQVERIDVSLGAVSINRHQKTILAECCHFSRSRQ